MRRVFTLPAALFLVVALGNCGQQTPSTEPEQSSLTAAPLARGQRTRAPALTPVIPQVVPTDEEVKASVLTRVHDDFMKILAAKAADYVLEGTVVSARAEAIHNTTLSIATPWIRKHGI
jgi:predicted small lipoprotein YifL